MIFLTEENKTIIKNIKLERINDIHTFIALMGQIENKIDICSEEYRINAKSVMGIYSINLSEPFDVVIYGDVSESFVQSVKRFEI